MALIGIIRLLGVGYAPHTELRTGSDATAYLAGFHAAQAFISEKVGKAVKSHHGVQAELHRLTKDDSTFPRELRPFLSQAYNLKAIADYETGPRSEVSAERATKTLEFAIEFVAYFESALGAPSIKNGNGPSAQTLSE